MFTEISGVYFDIHKHAPKFDFLKCPRSEDIFFFICLQYPKNIFVGEGGVSQITPFFPSGKSKVFMKRSLEQWWNDTERGKPKCWERNTSLPLCKTISILYKDSVRTAQ
jgi:hypothetical protein